VGKSNKKATKMPPQSIIWEWRHTTMIPATQEALTTGKEDQDLRSVLDKIKRLPEKSLK
jgi:hypothetical protein